MPEPGDDAQHIAAVDKEREALDLVSQVVDYAILGLDPYGVITTWNAGAERLKGYTAAEAVGQHFSIFYTPEDHRDGLPMQLLEQARTEGHVLHSGWRVRKDGTRFWGDVAITALHEDGQLVGYAKVTRDRTAEHELAESLRESEQRLRLLISQVVDYAIIGLDAYGVITTWNAGAERVKGYTDSEALGQHFSIFYTAEDRHDGLPLELLTAARREGRVEQSGWRVRKDGTRFWADVLITALHDDDGRLTGYSKVTRDRTDQHRLEQLQASLFAHLSHDIRAPLINIGAYAALLASSDPAERADVGERITAEAEQLDVLITSLFDYAKLRAGAVPIDLRQTTLGDVVRETLGSHQPLLAGRDVRVDDDGATAAADPVALRRVLANLVSNAIKYSPPGSPLEFAVRADGDRASIAVRDFGRGVAPSDIGVIFTEFVRGELATDDGGTGLGLASVKQLMELQGGTVRMESAVGVGTTVTVELGRPSDRARTPVMLGQ